MNSIKTLKDVLKVFAPGIRNYSQYSPRFNEPIYGEKERKEFLKDKNHDEVMNMRFKAAENDVTCSVFSDPDARTMTRLLMKRGNKIRSRRLMDDTFTLIKKIQLDKYHSAKEEAREEIELSPMKIFKTALENCTPSMGLKGVKRGGTLYRVPVSVSAHRLKFDGMKFIINAVLEKPKSERFVKYFAKELIEAAEHKGRAYTMKIALHKQCEANRAYYHYRWL